MPRRPSLLIMTVAAAFRMDPDVATIGLEMQRRDGARFAGENLVVVEPQ